MQSVWSSYFLSIAFINVVIIAPHLFLDLSWKVNIRVILQYGLVRTDIQGGTIKLAEFKRLKNALNNVLVFIFTICLLLLGCGDSIYSKSILLMLPSPPGGSLTRKKCFSFALTFRILLIWSFHRVYNISWKCMCSYL